MFKSLLFSAILLIGAHSGASTHEISVHQLMHAVKVNPQLTMINWTIGDSADYNVKGGFMNGTIHMFVREKTAEGNYWLQQDLKLGFLGDHKIETLLDAKNGKVLELLMDGQKQNIPETDQDIVDTRQEKVTVPKGTFDAFWVKIHDKKAGTDSQAWLNPTIVPIMGMLKSIQPSQMGEVTLELTDFKRN